MCNKLFNLHPFTIINKTYYISLKVCFNGITQLNTPLHIMSEKSALAQNKSDVKHNFVIHVFKFGIAHTK